MQGILGTVLITGASSGIGAETARLFHSKGWRVVLLARTAHKLTALADELGSNAIAEPLDASDGSAVLALKERLDKTIGIPDVIVNAAGAGRWLRIEDTPPEEARMMMGAPYLAAFNMTHAYMSDFISRDRGTIIMINSAASLMPLARAASYTASRWALRGLHEALCQDLAGTGVRSCHAVFPKVESEYFDNNPGTLENIPRIAHTIRPLMPTECAEVIMGLAERPRREILYPGMLAFYGIFNRISPRLVAWLLRSTMPRPASTSAVD
ncbi:MAG: SDR family oxidoreductase [Candidatus Thiodiazotropha sp.]|jgi:NADP-dependent 3-hydroxy acid dehydrogenase YdfG